MNFSKKIGVGLAMAGLMVNTGCGKTAARESRNVSVAEEKDQCVVVEKNKQKPDPVCGIENIRDAVGVEVRLGMAMVLCSNGDPASNKKTQVNVSCESPLWVASQETYDFETVCLHYTGCEKGYLVVRPEMAEGGYWEIRQ